MDDLKENLLKVKAEFESLPFKDSNKLDGLSRKLELYIKKLFGEKSSYLNDFIKINFWVMYAPAQEEAKMKAWESGKSKTCNLIDTIIEDLSLNMQKPPTQIINLNKPTKVFIVHGHDDLAKTEVARFIEKLGLEAVILHERPNLGATIIEKIERETDVGFGIVLYTPCDVGNSQAKSNELNARARQNVVFEHGYLVSKLKREKVVALVKGNVEKPSDIDGVVYEPMDSAGAWQYRIAKEMNAVGFDIDLSKI